VSRLNDRVRQVRLDAATARLVARALGDAVGDDRLVSEPPTNGGDEERLRGIPVIGGATGAIRGTIPGQDRRLDEWSGRRADLPRG
jgi:hypothetical protein